MHYKKLSCLFVCFILILGSSLIAKADLKYLYFEEGKIEMSFEDKKATTGTTYKTVGWIMHKTNQSNRDAYNKEPVGAMIGDDFQEVDSEPNGENVITNFLVNSDTVDYALAVSKLGGLKDGETLYLDSVFEVQKNGTGQGVYYYTYDGIKNAAPWGSQSIEDLKSYYNIPVPYASKATHPLYKEIKVNGETISKEKIGQSKTGMSHSVKFDDSINYKGGVANINKSYFYYELQRGQKLFELTAPATAVTDRNPTMYAGGITVVAEYIINPTVYVEHYNLDTNTFLEKEPPFTVSPGTTVKKSAKVFNGKSYIYSETSEDSGTTWAWRSDSVNRNVIVNKNTIIRFNYSAKSDLFAILNITANPEGIEKGKKETVQFTLDASLSKAKAGIKKYEFWFGDKNDFNRNPDFVVTNSIQTISQKEVAPKTKWFGKVRITDIKGAVSEATADITIKELAPVPKAEIKPNLRLNLIQDTERIVEWNGEDKEGRAYETENIIDGAKVWYGLEKYRVDIFVPAGEYNPVTLNFALDASNSESTNGIGDFRFYDEVRGVVIQNSPSSITNAFSVRLPRTPQDVIDGKFSNDYSDSSIIMSCMMNDSIVTNEKAWVDVTLQYRYVFEKAPGVTLLIDKNEFGLGETAHFTPGFIEDKETPKIERKSWIIQSIAGDFNEIGEGEIPLSYRLNLAADNYIARQYIYYSDKNHNTVTAFAEVKFSVYGIKPPSVTIACDKEKYIIPETGKFAVTFSEDNKFTYQIVNKSYRLKTIGGKIITEGVGEFPKTYPFTIDLDAGNYIAEQTIYWWELGEYKSKTAICQFKLISPIPVADFDVKMKMSLNENDWKRIDVSNEKGKVNKQIRIDLTPSIQTNIDLENQSSIIFNSSNTQIQIIPLDAGKENKIYTPNSNDIIMDNQKATITGKQYIDIRFDDYGTYKIKCRVATAQYTSSFVERNIIISEDLPPIVDIKMENVIVNDKGENTVLRDINDLHVRFNVKTSAISQDDDTINYDTAKLQMKFDYDANFDTSDDDGHSEMYVTKNIDSLKNYVKISKNSTMTEFNVDMHSNDFPILGKMYFEYFVEDKPTIPNFIAPTMPNVPILTGTTENIDTYRKIVIADNRQGSIQLDLGKDSKIEITIIMGKDTPSFDYHALADYYGENAIVYVIDMYGNRQVIS